MSVGRRKLRLYRVSTLTTSPARLEFHSSEVERASFTQQSTVMAEGEPRVATSLAVGSTVLPGDDVTAAVTVAGDQLRLGGGLIQRGDCVFASKAGVLAHRAPNRFFLLCDNRRYVPATGDTIVGVVVDKLSESYRVQLHGTTTALLPVLAFDGATKRNKPNLEVRSASRCALSSSFVRHTWMTCISRTGATLAGWNRGFRARCYLLEAHGARAYLPRCVY